MLETNQNIITDVIMDGFDVSDYDDIKQIKKDVKETSKQILFVTTNNNQTEELIKYVGDN